MANPVVVFQTSKGTFEAEIYSDKMPITAGARFNFPQAVRAGGPRQGGSVPGPTKSLMCGVWQETS